MRLFWRGVPLVVGALAGSACGVTDTERAPVGTVLVRPPSLEVAQGATAALDVEVKDANGSVLRDRRVVWASANPSIATVSDRGVVSGVSAGQVDVAATAEGKSAIASVTVVAAAPKVTSVRVSPDKVNLFVAGSSNLIATPYDTRGAAITGRSVVWTTNNAGVAAISQTGRVTGVLPGTAVITAVIDGLAGHATVEVSLVPVARVTVSPSSLTLAAGKTATLKARVSDAADNELSGRVVSWSSSDTRIVTVDQAGVIRAVRRGNATITATSEGKFGTASVRVN